MFPRLIEKGADMSSSMSEAQVFREAMEKIGEGDTADGIAKLIDLSLNAKSYTMRLWARNYLTQSYNLAFVENDDETASQASPVQG